MKRIATLLLITLLFMSCNHGKRTEIDSVQNDTIYPLGFLTDTLDIEEYQVERGQTFGVLLTKLGMDPREAYNLCQVCDSVFDPRKIVAGKSYQAYYTIDSLDRQLHYIVYQNDRIHQTIFQCFDSLAVWTVTKPVDYEIHTADVIINSSLWNDMLSAGASPDLILKLSDIYAWTVDFFGLRKEDRFRVLYGQSVCEGDVISVDSIYFSIFSRGEKDLCSILFDQGDNGNLYWNENGESMRKAFLKAPLHFNRVSSGFSYARKHPVSGKVKPHTAVDYAAPTGTPVMSIGDGTVISKGYAGGGGNTVKIRHNSVYTTAYLHLSRYAKGLQVGQRVRQGEVIGYVGMTGTATGPHLDFRVWKNGSPINPLTLESPSQEPIKPENKPALDSMYLVYRQRLEM